MTTRVPFVCDLRNGIHARPASMLAEAVAPFTSTVTIAKAGGAPVDARSVLSVVGLDIQLHDHGVIEISGSDAEAATAAVRRLIGGEWVKGDDHPPAAASPTAGDRSAVLPHGLRTSDARHWSGTPACAGVGRGFAVHVAGLALPAAMQSAKPGSVTEELATARAAFADVTADLRRRAAATKKKFESDLLSAHAQIADDPALWAEVERRVRGGATAAQAVVDAATRFMDQLRRAGSAYVRDRVVDIQDVCMQVIDRLRGGENAATEITLTRESVLVADVLTANQLMRLDHSHLKGLVLGSVGATSHTVILARSLRIPTLLDVSADIAAGADIIVDGGRGLVIDAAFPEVRRFYEVQDRTLRRRREQLAPVARRPAATRDGRRLEVGANASTPGEVSAAVELGAEGVGLLRTELLFLDRPAAPSEAEQFESYRAVVQAAAGRPVIIRTFDIGGDKPAAYMGIPQEENPFLGCRGIRLYPQYQALLRDQLRAIVRASACGPVKVMAPMVATPDEAAWFRQQVKGVQAELAAENAKFDPDMPIGVMVEVPAVSMAMEELCRHCDFLSIGTNDLCQYWMAVDRGNKAVAPLYNARQPSFLRLLASIIGAARKHGTWIGVCGEMAGDRMNLPLLVAMGVDEISAAPGEALNLKAAVAGLDAQQCQSVLEAALKCTSVAEVEACLRSASAQAGSGQSRSILDRNALLVGSDAQTKAEAITEAVDALFVAGRTDRPGAVEDAVWAREATYSTGLGYGFAVPHCKTDAVAAPSLAVVKLAAPVEWGSSDGLPVSVVILLAVPAADTAGTHMKVFAKLARKLMHEGFRERLSTAADTVSIEAALREELQID